MIEKGEYMITIKDVSLDYDGKVIFKDFNYCFSDHNIYCILGKSGTGKTTLLRMISGLLKPSYGSIYMDEDRITKPTSDIFMMHQNYVNFPWKTCLENVLFPLSLKNRNVNDMVDVAVEILCRVGIGEYIHKYPYELSGGMKQRLALARTLIMRPKVILMDEPLSALDSETRENMQKLIKEFHEKNNNIIIMVTHDKKEAFIMAEKENVKFMEKMTLRDYKDI
jgi:ABC-type nitrate/sulfonate/bicarbonate transport system ATPase subunit